MPPLKSKGQTVDKKPKAEEVKPETKRQKNEKNSESKTTQPSPKVPNGKHKVESPTPEKRKTCESNAKGRTNKDAQKRGTAQDAKRPADAGKRSVNGRAVKRRVKKKGESQVIIKGRANRAGKLPASPKAVKRKVGPPSKNVPRQQSSDSEDDESESVRSSESEREEEDSKDDEEGEEGGAGSNEEPAETQGSSESSDGEAEVSDSLKDLKRDTEGPTAGEESDKEPSERAETRSATEEEPDEEDHAEEVPESEAAHSDSSDGGEEVRKERTPERQTTGRGVRGGRRQSPRATEPPQRQRGRMFKKTKADKLAEKAEKARAKAETQRAEKEAKQKAKEEKKNKKKKKKQGASAEPEKVEPPEGPNKTEKARSKAQLLLLANKTKNIKQVTVASDTDPDEEEDEEEEEEEEEEEATPTLLPATKSRSQLIILKAKSTKLKTSLLSKAAKEGQKEAGDPLVNPSEEASEGESNKANERLLARKRGVATLRRVSGWINKKIPKSFTLKTKMVPWCKVISISNWISLRALKPKDGTRKSKGNFLKHRMAMRMASKTNLSSVRSRSDGKDRRCTEKAVPQGQVGDGGDETVPVGDKELEAKYAVVLPRINKPGLAKALTVASAPTNSTLTPGSATPSTPKPPKPGARLVLPVKPDLSLLKCIKKPVLGGSTAGGESVEGGTVSGVRATAAPSVPEGSSDIHARSRQAPLENQDGVSVLQAARGKLGTRNLNLTKTSLLGGSSPALGPARPRGPDPEREMPTRGPRATAEAVVQNGGTGRMGAGATYEEEADREVAQLMCDDEATYAAGQPEIHWAGCAQMTGDPQDWLRGENLLPQQTVEKLTRRTVYDDDDRGRGLTVPAHNGRGPWESEDPAQDMLESRLNSTQVVMAGSEQAVEVDEVEDLAQLDEVCESSVLLNLKKRFHRDCIYTYIGDMLISVNPFRPLHIYTEDSRLQYQAKAKHRNPPHVYAIAEAAFTHSQNTAQEQCIVISGQSGSGKTEATKLIIHYLCSMYQGMHDNLRQPTEVLPILESFGNAKTILNNNSSRFGKYLHIHILQ